MNNKELELEAKEYVKDIHAMYQPVGIDCFTAGATSGAAKKYWYEKLKNYLADEYKNRSSMPNKDMLSEEQYLFKIASDAGIRVFIKELEQKLSEL